MGETQELRDRSEGEFQLKVVGTARNSFWTEADTERQVLMVIRNPQNCVVHVSAPPCRAHDTVGAVAVDSAGNVACATSTGGIRNKMVGRVGDSPIIGAMA